MTSRQGWKSSMPSGTDHHMRPGRVEVLARAGVVDAAVVGGGEHALDAPDRLGDVEVHVGHLDDRAVGEVLHPVAERLAAVDDAARGRRRGGRRPRRRRRRARIALGGGGHLVGEALAAPSSPRRRSRRGRPRRRGSSGWRARSARARRLLAREPCGSSSSVRNSPKSAKARAGAPARARAARSRSPAGDAGRPGRRRSRRPRPSGRSSGGPARRPRRTAATPTTLPLRASSASVTR